MSAFAIMWLSVYLSKSPHFTFVEEVVVLLNCILFLLFCPSHIDESRINNRNSLYNSIQSNSSANYIHVLCSHKTCWHFLWLYFENLFLHCTVIHSCALVAMWENTDWEKEPVCQPFDTNYLLEFTESQSQQKSLKISETFRCSWIQ